MYVYNHIPIMYLQYNKYPNQDKNINNCTIGEK